MGKRTGRPRGRPSKFNATTKRAILDAIRCGNYVVTACQAAGIGTSTLTMWRSKAEEEQSTKAEVHPFSDFMAEMAAAEAACEKEVVRKVHKATTDDPELGLKLLARRHPERWGDRTRTELSGPGGKPIQVEQKLTWVDLMRKAEEAEKEEPKE